VGWWGVYRWGGRGRGRRGGGERQLRCLQVYPGDELADLFVGWMVLSAAEFVEGELSL
jgi:hypothetical protein